MNSPGRAEPDPRVPQGQAVPSGLAVASLGTVTVVHGPEELRRSRAVAAVIDAVRAVEPGAEIEQVDGASLDVGILTGLTGPSLFAAPRVVVLAGADLLSDGVAAELLELSRVPEPDCAVVVVHPGGSRGRGVVDGLRRGGARMVPCERPKPRDIPVFAADEATRLGVRFGRGAAQALCDAVGNDLAEIAAAVAQLVEDAPPGTPALTLAHVHTYYGGLAEVSGFDIADALYAGRREQALTKLRWALRVNVPPVLLASALATGARSLLRSHGLRRGVPDSEAARILGVPPWKVASVRSQARAWDPVALGAAVGHAAALDLAVKGGTADPAFALELAVLRIAELHTPVTRAR